MNFSVFLFTTVWLRYVLRSKLSRDSIVITKGITLLTWKVSRDNTQCCFYSLEHSWFFILVKLTMDNTGFVGFHVRSFLLFVHANAKFKLFGHLQFNLLFLKKCSCFLGTYLQTTLKTFLRICLLPLDVYKPCTTLCFHLFKPELSVELCKKPLNIWAHITSQAFRLQE